MILRLTIEPDGSVSMCVLQGSDMKAPQLAAEVVERVKTFDFGAKEGIVAITILYPIDFLPATLNPQGDENPGHERLSQELKRDSDKGKPTERWRRKVTGLKGPRAPGRRDRRNRVRPSDFLRLPFDESDRP